MHYFNNNYWGMNGFWWIIWIVFIIWIFATPWDIPGQRKRKNTALDILNRRVTNGEITKEEFEEKKKILQQN